jgi:hypothetical protein
MGLEVQKLCPISKKAWMSTTSSLALVIITDPVLTFDNPHERCSHRSI